MSLEANNFCIDLSLLVVGQSSVQDTIKEFKLVKMPDGAMMVEWDHPKGVLKEQLPPGSYVLRRNEKQECQRVHIQIMLLMSCVDPSLL